MNTTHPKRKQESITRKQTNHIINRTRFKANNQPQKNTSRIFGSPEIRTSAVNNTNKSKIQENASFLQANVSAIEGSSFLSNKQDGSMDSMDQIIIGVGLDQKLFQEEESVGEGSRGEIDFNEINKQYQQLFGRKILLGEEQEVDDMSENQPSLQQSQQHSYPPESQPATCSPKKTPQTLKQYLQKIQLKVEEVHRLNSRKLQDISTNSIKILAGNLSEIHQEKQINLNNSIQSADNRDEEEDEEEFYEFVSQPDPADRPKKQESERENEEQNDENQEDNEQLWEQQNPMFPNLELELIKTNPKLQQPKNKPIIQNYQPILEGLNSKQQQDQCNDTNNNIPTNTNPNNINAHHTNNYDDKLQDILKRRQDWIVRNSSKRNQGWMQKERKLLETIRNILRDPEYEEEDCSDASCL